MLSKDFLSSVKGPLVSSSHYILFDSVKNITITQRAEQQREVASLTKIMTTIVALEFIDSYGLDRGTVYSY